MMQVSAACADLASIPEDVPATGRPGFPGQRSPWERCAGSGEGRARPEHPADASPAPATLAAGAMTWKPTNLGVSRRPSVSGNSRSVPGAVTGQDERVLGL